MSRFWGVAEIPGRKNTASFARGFDLYSSNGAKSHPADEWIDQRIERLREKSQEAGKPGPGLIQLRDLAVAVTDAFGWEATEWSKYISRMIPAQDRDPLLTGIIGLRKNTASLDDLFGERVSGWARQISDFTLIEQLAPAVGSWILDDLSRIGYAEAWVVRGETQLKKRLGILATLSLNKGGNSYPLETFRVLRHTMSVDDEELLVDAKAVICQVQNQDEVLKFLAWWAPRCSARHISLFRECLDPEHQEKLDDVLKI